jgi:hypothetical protein
LKYPRVINDDTIEIYKRNKTETMTRSSTFLLLLLVPLSASAFTVLPSLRNPSTTAVFMSDSVETGTNLVLTGNNIELTPALQEYAQKRIGGLLEKLGGGGIVRECEVHLSVSKNPKVGTVKTAFLVIVANVMFYSRNWSFFVRFSAIPTLMTNFNLTYISFIPPFRLGCVCRMHLLYII